MQKNAKVENFQKKNAKVEDFFDLRKLTDILLGNHPNCVKFTRVNLTVANFHPNFTEHIIDDILSPSFFSFMCRF